MHIRLEHPEKSAIAEHNIDHGHSIQSHNSSILATKTRYMDSNVKEAMEMISTLTISTERLAYVSANHGSLL
jgi:hypothetical protein